MATISSDTLFHFTSSLENLLNIIENDFIPSYTIETISHISKGDSEPAFAFPMLCFCDIPLSQIHNHLEIYGNYGIGLRKEWGAKNNLNPILYLRKNSNLSSSIKKIVEGTDGNKLEDEIFDVLRYLKPYKGSLDGKSHKFYDEREWRYSPVRSSETPIVMESKHVKNETDFFNKASNILKENHTLKINPDDIKYLIVSSEDEIHEIIESISEIKGDEYTSNQMKLVNSKVISIDQIKADF